MPVRSASLFKVTVFLLAVPAVLMLGLTILTVLVTLVSGQSGIGSVNFGFALTRWQVMIAIAMGLGAIILFFVLALAFFRPRKGQKTGVNR